MTKLVNKADSLQLEMFGPTVQASYLEKNHLPVLLVKPCLVYRRECVSFPLWTQQCACTSTQPSESLFCWAETLALLKRVALTEDFGIISASLQVSVTSTAG